MAALECEGGGLLTLAHSGTPHHLTTQFHSICHRPPVQEPKNMETSATQHASTDHEH